MNRYRYLEILSRNLGTEIPEEEYNNVMEYYTEYFTEAGPEREAEVIAELGAPENVAKRIIAEYLGKTVEQMDAEASAGKKKGLSTGWFVFIAIVCSPIWLALFFVALGVAIAVFSVIAAISAAAIACLFAGIVLVLTGIVNLFTDPATGALIIGTGFITGAIGCALGMLAVLIISSIVRLVKYITRKRNEKRGIA